MSQGKARDACNDTSPLMTTFTHQQNNDAHTGSSQPGPSNYVTSKEFQHMDDKWAEHFAWYKVLLTFLLQRFQQLEVSRLR